MNGSSEDNKILLERLGKPEILAAQAEQIQYNSWSGRHPWIAFFCGPMALFLGLFFAMAWFSVICLFPLIRGETMVSKPWTQLPCSVLGHLQLMSITVIASILLCRLLQKSYRRLAWWVLSCGVISILCCMADLRWEVLALGPYDGKFPHGIFSVGFSIPFYSMSWFARRLPRVLVPIGIFMIGALLSRKPPSLQRVKLVSVPTFSKATVGTAFPR